MEGLSEGPSHRYVYQFRGLFFRWPMTRLLTAMGCTVHWTCRGYRAALHVGTAEGKDDGYES